MFISKTYVFGVSNTLLLHRLLLTVTSLAIMSYQPNYHYNDCVVISSVGIKGAVCLNFMHYGIFQIVRHYLSALLYAQLKSHYALCSGNTVLLLQMSVYPYVYYFLEQVTSRSLPRS